MKRAWKSIEKNYWQNVKFRIEKKILPCLAVIHVLQQMKMMMKIASTSLFFFHALIKKEGEVLISLHEFRYCKILWQPLLFLILLRLLLFWGTEWCKKFFLLWKTFVSSKKRKLFVLKRVAIICQLQIKLWYVPLCIYCIIETRVDDPAVVNFFLLWPNH